LGVKETFMKSLHREEKGFTLIELVIAIAILGILAAVIVPNLATFLTTGDVAAANTEVANLESAASAYYADNYGTWPTNSTTLSTDGYISAVPKYAVYTFTSFGKVDTVTENSPAADDIEWNAGAHEWQKGEAPAPAPPVPVPPVPHPPVPIPIQPIPHPPVPFR
jgi:prepilin-type N-terminal cleavage/methylation domain-containing protein